MFCANCGAANADTNRFCTSCGHALNAAAPPPAPDWQPPTENPASPPETPAASPIAPTETHTSGKAIASLITGIFFCFLPCAIAAVILGHNSRGEIRRSGGRIQGKGMALAGLILGYLGIALFPVLLIAAIAIPNLLHSRLAANEAAAILSVHTIVEAETAYDETYPKLGFTCSLTDLGPGSGVPNPRAAQLIDSRLASGTKNGYQFTLAGCDQGLIGDYHHRTTTYSVIATPVKPGQTGVRAFCADTSGVVRFDLAGDGLHCLGSGQPYQ
jgi:hypothetical protein